MEYHVILMEYLRNTFAYLGTSKECHVKYNKLHMNIQGQSHNVAEHLRNIIEYQWDVMEYFSNTMNIYEM